MLATFASSFAKSRPACDESRKLIEPTEKVSFHGTDLATAELDEIQSALGQAVLGKFGSRLSRVGLAFASPVS